MLKVFNPGTLSRDSVIEHFTDNLKEYQKFAKNIAGEQWEDLFQECTLMLLEFKEDRIVGYWNPKQGLKPFFLRMLTNQFKSNTSKFDKQYRKHDQFIQTKGEDVILNTPQNYEAPKDDYIDKINSLLAERYSSNPNRFIAELERMIWDLYIKTGSLRKCLISIPNVYTGLFDLKDVHVIVKKIQRTIKKHMAALE